MENKSGWRHPYIHSTFCTPPKSNEIKVLVHSLAWKLCNMTLRIFSSISEKNCWPWFIFWRREDWKQKSRQSNFLMARFLCIWWILNAILTAYVKRMGAFPIYAPNIVILPNKISIFLCLLFGQYMYIVKGNNVAVFVVRTVRKCVLVCTAFYYPFVTCENSSL